MLFLPESGFSTGTISDANCVLGNGGPAWMTRPYSEDLRELALALARADAGETVRSIAEARTSVHRVCEVEESAAGNRRRFARQHRRSQEAGSVGHQRRLAAQTHSLWTIHFAEADPR